MPYPSPAGPARDAVLRAVRAATLRLCRLVGVARLVVEVAGRDLRPARRWQCGGGRPHERARQIAHRVPLRFRDTLLALEREGCAYYVDRGLAGTMATFVKHHPEASALAAVPDTDTLAQWAT
jgi:hypothetical protein